MKAMLGVWVAGWIACSAWVSACSSDSDTGNTPGSGGAVASGGAGGSNGGSVASGGIVGSGGIAAGGGPANGGTPASGGAASGGTPGCPGLDGKDGGATRPVTDAGTSDASTDGSAPRQPYVRAGGVGVTDLEKATSFLTGVVSMTQEGADVTREDRIERTFWAKEAGRGSRVVLMKFNDGRNTKDITAKLVFQASDVAAAYQKALDAGYASILPPIPLGPITVSQVKGPEGYTVEFLTGIDAAGAGIPQPYFIALAFGVSDFCAARKFYATAFGMIETLPYADNDLQEQSFEYPQAGGAGLVLQHYVQSTHVYKNNPVKHVSYVPDVAAYVARIQSAGGTVVQQPAAMPAYDGKMGAVLKDPDGYVVELVQE